MILRFTTLLFFCNCNEKVDKPVTFSFMKKELVINEMDTMLGKYGFDAFLTFNQCYYSCDCKRAELYYSYYDSIEGIWGGIHGKCYFDDHKLIALLIKPELKSYYCDSIHYSEFIIELSDEISRYPDIEMKTFKIKSQSPFVLLSYSNSNGCEEKIIQDVQRFMASYLCGK